MDHETLKDKIKDRYAGAAKSETGGCCGDNDCCSGGSDLIQLIDYAELEEGLPQGANLGLGCGLPTRTADFMPGEVVLDLGSGAGVDVFLAARAVGPSGRVIGVDMTPEMIARAEANARQGGYGNVEFHLGEIESLPVESGSVDVVISNCVLNLVPDKKGAFREIFRVLKPGGRFSIADMATYGPVPAAVRADMDLWAGCVAGAPDRDEYLALLEATGFTDIRVLAETRYDDLKGEDYGLLSLTVVGRKET